MTGNMFFEPDLEQPVDHRWEDILERAENMDEKHIREDLLGWGLIEELDDETEIGVQELWAQMVYSMED